MSDFLNLWIEGVESAGKPIFHISGDQAGDEGVELRDKPQNLVDAPHQTFWTDNGFRQVFQTDRFKRRDITISLNIWSPSDDPDDWRDIDSQIRMALGNYRDTFKLFAETSDGVRFLQLQLLQEPKAYEAGEWEGKDPHLYAASTITFTAAAPIPFWIGDTLVDKCTFTGTSGTQYVTVSNPGDVAVFLRWRVPASCLVTLPDWSWGSNVFGRASEDAARTWAAPQLYAGENTIFDSMPDMPVAIASNKAPVRYRCNGAPIYPVAPHTKPTQVPVTLVSGPANSTIYVENDQWFSRLWGVSR